MARIAHWHAVRHCFCCDRLRFAAGSEDSVRLVTALLQVSAFPDNDICSMSLNFWHRFARFLTDPIDRQPSVEGEPIP